MLVNYSLGDVYLADEAENYLTAIEGIIKTVGNQDEEAVIGEIVAYHIDAEALREDGTESLFEVMDTTQEFYECFSALFDDDTQMIKKELVHHFGWYQHISSANLLFITDLDIHPEYQDRKLDLAALYRTIQQFAHGDTLVVLELPLVRPNVPLAEADIDYVEEQAYYGQLGFTPIPHQPQYLILNPRNERPNLENIGFDVERLEEEDKGIET